MESRRVILLTDGYLHGWLDFKYKNPLSRAREEHILNCIEERKFAEVRQVRTIMDGIIGAGLRSPDLIKSAFASYDSYLELALPYLVKTDKLDPVAQKNELGDIKSFLRKKKLEMLNQPVD